MHVHCTLGSQSCVRITTGHPVYSAHSQKISHSFATSTQHTKKHSTDQLYVLAGIGIVFLLVILFCTVRLCVAYCQRKRLGRYSSDNLMAETNAESRLGFDVSRNGGHPANRTGPYMSQTHTPLGLHPSFTADESVIPFFHMASKQRGHQEVGPFKYTISEQPSFANERDRLQFESAQKFETMYPYNSIPTRLTQDQYVYIEEYGVNAWQFVPPVDPRLSPTLGVDLAPKDLHHLVRVRDRTEVEFLPVGNQGEGSHEPHQECLVHTNLPLPTSSAVSYFEVKLQKKPDQTNVAIGLATKPYPTWRLCGWNKHSVGIHSDSGSLYHNSPFKATLCGEKFREGDIMGCGYIPAQGMVFFTQNGYRLPTCLTNVSKNFFPAVSANGPCQLSVNLGQRGFVYIEANVKHWGLGPIEGNLLPPPKYADAIHSTLLASADYNEDAESDTDTAVQGSSRRSSMNSDMTVDDMNPQVTHHRTPSPTRVPPGLVTVVPMDWHLHPHDLADNFSGTLPRHEQRSPIYPPTPASASLQMPEPALVHSPLLNEVDMGNSQLDQHRR